MEEVKKLFELIRPTVIEYDVYRESEQELIYGKWGKYYPGRQNDLRYNGIPTHLRVKLPELRKLAIERNIKGCKSMKKAELIKALLE
jgi:hypothetical protein